MKNATAYKMVRKELENFIKNERVTCTMQLYAYAGGYYYGDDVPYFVIYDVIREFKAKYGLVDGWE